MYTQNIRNKDVRDFVYLTSPVSYVEAAIKAKTTGLFTELNATDLWLGELAEDCRYMGYMFKANWHKDQTFEICVGTNQREFSCIPAGRKAAKALVALIAAKHPFIYALNACAQGVDDSIGWYELGGPARLSSVFASSDNAVLESITDFVSSFK